MNISNRLLLSVSVYHLRQRTKSGGYLGDKWPGFEFEEGDDGSLIIGGEAPPGSEIEITWPDGSQDVVEVGDEGGWDATSPPGQPSEPGHPGLIVRVSYYAIALEDDEMLLELTESGSEIWPEFARNN